MNLPSRPWHFHVGPSDKIKDALEGQGAAGGFQSWLPERSLVTGKRFGGVLVRKRLSRHRARTGALGTEQTVAPKVGLL